MTIRGKTSATMAMSWLLTSSVSGRACMSAIDLAPATRVEAGRGFVEDEHAGIHGEHGGQGDALPLAEREVMGDTPL